MIPKTVNICGIPHKVNLCADNYNTDLHFGQIEYGKAEIRINDSISEELKMQTLFHEMLHGMLVMIGQNDAALDEQFVQSLSNAMYQSFRLKEEET